MLLIAPIIVLTIVGYVGNALHPTLLNEHPLWLVAMEPRFRYLLLVAAKVDFAPFVVVATVRRLLSDPLFYLLGFLYGDAGVRWVERQLGDGGGLVRAAERWFSKAAPVMVLLWPGLVVCMLAGATGMSVSLFLGLNVAGTVLTTAALWWFADVEAVRRPLEAVTDFYGRNGMWLTVVSVVLTGVWLTAQQRRGRTEIQALAELEHEIEDELEGDHEIEDDETGP